MNSLCPYYQATIAQKDCWFFVAALRSYEHLAFDRTFDVEKSIFEFFVAPSEEEIFLELMHFFEQEGLVTELKKLPNRFSDEQTQRII
jgi:hypothetical protein